PLDCRPGETCWLMNLPDTDPGPAARDFRCRPRSYDKHDGTDLAVADLRAMQAGVAVRAAAAGTVLQTRDGEEDGRWLRGDGAAIRAAKRECGNRVAIAHGDGWVTDYCHLKQGSVIVKKGDKVAAGQAIGQVGLSGMTEFPHVHLGLLRFAPGQNTGVAVDPFTGVALSEGCGKPAGGLWNGLGYQPVALYAVGLADHVPAAEALKSDSATPEAMPRTAPALVVWGTMFGVAPGDKVTMTLQGPDGAVIDTKAVSLDRDQAWHMRAFGKKTPPGGWPAGRYVGRVTLEREGEPPQAREAAIVLR
ncbi:MAG TPA: M23 family metallopeptidase, partial [Candidatus Omnitrophota bacterium]|nr:M23 family metallopeptidase [Candidatus Omnitrophota bacterium]